MREYLSRHVSKPNNDGDVPIGKLEAYRLFIHREIEIYKCLNMIKSPRDADNKETSPIRHGLLWVPTESNFE